MRPRHKAAENAVSGASSGPSTSSASMRPRHKAAENQGLGVGRGVGGFRFNEAAA